MLLNSPYDVYNNKVSDEIKALYNKGLRGGNGLSVVQISIIL